MKFIDKERFNPSLSNGIAHRGLHDDTHPENSLSAFENAIDHNLCFELDVHLTKDGQVVVSHDFNLMRMTGRYGIIEDMTFEEIRKNHRLKNGENIPTLQEVLDLNDERQTIVIELKARKGNDRRLARKVMELLRQVRDETKVTLISFFPKCLLFCDERYTKGLIVERSKSYMLLFKSLFDYIDVENTMLTDRSVMKYRAKGGLVSTWTIKDEESYCDARNLCDMLTFEGFDLNVVKR